jgi:hypothetical protein
MLANFNFVLIALILKSVKNVSVTEHSLNEKEEDSIN